MKPFREWFSKTPEPVVEKSEPRLTLDDIAGRDTALSQKGSLKIEAFYSCVRDKSETIAQLPLRLYRTNADGSREQVKGNRLHRIFTKQPNDYQTIIDFIQMIVVSLETVGAFYAYKERNDRGNVMAIIPFFHQRNVKPAADLHGNIYYNYVYNDGRPGDPYNIEDMVIIKNFTLDGYTPISPIDYLATILGISKSQEDSYRELQTNGITAQMALATDAKLVDENAVTRLKEDWNQYRGVSGRKSIPILEEGLKPVNLRLTPAESDLIQHREFSVTRIASALKVPLYRINMHSGTISKGVIPEFDESYMRNSLQPILVKIEHALNDCLPSGTHIEFNRKAYYAGSPWRLVEHVSMELKSGACMINEAREDLGREPVEGGDVYVIDSNNATYGKWEELPAVREQVNGRAANAVQGDTDVIEE